MFIQLSVVKRRLFTRGRVCGIGGIDDKEVVYQGKSLWNRRLFTEERVCGIRGIVCEKVVY